MATKKPQKNTASEQSERAPVVVIMGHIDHGKSTLLDYIRKTNIVDKEAGGITQHISAYEVVHEKDGLAKKITFLDTPGHEAFSKMRSRGAIVADIAVLVVSAEDGVKPQTIEAIKAIRVAGLPYVVAINKIDKPNANVELTKQKLAEADVYLEGYGGDISWVAISAKTGQGVSELLDLILLLAEIADLKGSSNKKAEGIVIETKLDTKKGISAVLVIKDGALHRGAYIVAGDAWAPIRIMENFLGKPIESATFGSPVQIIGWSKLPEVGSLFYAVDSKKDAEAEAMKYATEIATVKAANTKNVVVKVANNGPVRVATTNGNAGGAGGINPVNGVTSGDAIPLEKVVIPVILKADTVGSIEGIEHEIGKIKNDLVEVKLIQKGIGPISEIDIKGALGTQNAVVLGFNVKSDSAALNLADRSEILVQNFNIIYKLSEYLSNLAKEKEPKPTEEIRGTANILKVFSIQRDKQVIGGKVTSGKVMVGEVVTIRRRTAVIGTGKIRNLQQMKADTDAVVEGKEFGAQIESKIELATGDTIEAIKLL
jgi:translation initiation factor IF-2